MILMTGASGFLGSAILPLLLAKGERVRAFVLPGDPLAKLIPKEVEICCGDLLSEGDLDRFFALKEGETAVVIHCASLISMSMVPVDKVYQVNVKGVEKIISRCLNPKVIKLIYVSSVHAITELPHGDMMAEPEGTDPDQVVGYYAKTKAEAAALVTRARKEKALNANIVYPSGLCGPGDYAAGNLTQMFLDYFAGKIPVGIRGGYNFVDVRDVAGAIVTLAERGLPGRDYILAGEYISMMDILDVFHKVSGGKKVRIVCPHWLARLALPMMSLGYKIRKIKPIFSIYALKTITFNSLFSSAKAKGDLGFDPRPIEETLEDTFHWLKRQGMINGLKFTK